IRLVMLVHVPQRRSPAAARGGLLLFFAFRYFGRILYWVFGRRFLPGGRFEFHRPASLRLAPPAAAPSRPSGPHPHLPKPSRQAVTLAENLGDFGILGGNQVELLEDYSAAIDRVVADIDGAAHHVHLLYYT